MKARNRHDRAGVEEPGTPGESTPPNRGASSRGYALAERARLAKEANWLLVITH